MNKFLLVMSVMLVGAGCAKNPVPAVQVNSTSTTDQSVVQPVLATTTEKTEPKKVEAVKPAKVSLTDSILTVGSWDKVSGNLDFEFGFDSIEFYESGKYSGYLGGSHLNDGRWDLSGGNLDLVSDSQDEVLFTDLSLVGDTLTMKQGTKTIIWKHNK